MYGVKNWPGARQILSVVIFLLMVSTGAFLPAAAHADVAYTVTGNSQIIVPDDLTPSTFDGTDFGSVLVGSSVVDRTFVITNTGSESFDISNIVFTSSLTDFSIISPTSATLAPGGTFDLVIRLDPAEAETNTTEVRIIVPTGATNNPFRITGTGEGGVPDINVKGRGFRISDGSTTPSHSYDTDFGSANVTGGLVSKTYTIENTGTGLLTLGANAATRTGAHAGDFTVTSQPAETVAAGGSTTVTVQFNPSAEGLRTATLSIANDDPDENPYDFSIQGTGTIPDISLEGNNVTIANGDTTPDVADYTDLGSRDIDAGGSTFRDFRVRNIGTGTLTLAVDAVTFSGPHAADFSVPDQPHTSLNAGQSDLFAIRFNPSALGLRTATVSVASDDPDEPSYTFAIAGTGTGEPVIAISGNGSSVDNSLTWPRVSNDTDFGKLAVDGGSDTHTFTITNTGNAPLTLTGSPRVVLSGTEVSDYTLVSDADATIAAYGGTTAFSIRFAPAANGDRNAVVSIANNDSDRSPYSFKLTGEGTGPAILVEGNNLEIVDGDTSPSIADFTDFGVTDINSGVADRTFYINNDGTDPLLLPSGAVLSGPHKDDFSVTSQPDSSLNRSTRSNLNIRFVPSAAGVRTATVTIPNNDPNRDSFSFTIQGTGSSAPEIVVTGNGINIVRHVAVPLFNTADGTDFGTVSANGTMVDRTFVIKNIGSAPLNLGANAVTVAYPLLFSVVTQPASILAPGQTTSFTLRYTATLIGSYGTSAVIQNDDGDESPFIMSIMGAGVASLPEINVLGNGQSIVDGDASPDVADHTDFGSVDVATGTVSRTFTIENTGTDVLTITSAGLTGADTADFSITTDPTGTVAASDSTTVVVEFNPTTAGPKSVTLTISSDDGDEAAYDFALAGTGTGAPEINVVGNSLTIADGDTTPDVADHTDFGSADVTAGTVSRTFTIENTGTDVLTITSAGLTGADTADFSITTDPTGTVAASDSTTVVVEFNPTTAGPKSVTLTINSDDGDEAAYDFALAGTGTGAAEINVVGNSLTIADGDTTPDVADHTDFGSADVATGTVSRTFTIENTGTDVLTITSAGLTGADTADFSITTDPTGTVAASDSTTVVVEFNPTTAGPKSVTLTINSDDGDEAAYDFALAGTGTGAAEINVTGNSVSIVDGDTTPDVADHTDFGSVDVTAGTVSRTFTIENTGTDVLTITSAGLTGADTADFSITTDPTGTVAASDSTTVVVEFNPTTVGPKSVTLTINSDDGDEAAYDFALAGTGTGAAEINVVGNSLTIADGDTTPDVADHTDFGSADVATGTVSRTFTIENTGTDVLTITSAALSGADTGEFSIITAPAGTVAASNSTTVVVEFNPTAAGLKSATLTINSDDADEAAYDFALAGTGTGAAEINVTGNSVSIVDGDTTPDVADHTDFGSVDVTAGTVSRTFTIENTGTDVLTITSAGLTGADTADFSITTDPTGIVAASDSTTVVVEFNPTTVGPKSVTLTINSDDGDEAAYDFALAGTGTGAAEINVVGNSLTIADGDTTPDVADHTDFGSADVATGTVSRTFTIENTGTDVLTITSAALSGADTGEFSIITAPAGTVAASNSTTVVVEFNPTAAGLKSATLTINSDDADEAVYDFALAGTGTGEPEINVVGNSLTIADGDTTPDVADHTDFGSADVATGTVSRTFTIENTGTDVLTITSAGLTGADTADFSITTDPTGTVAASDSTTVVVEFNPTTAGPKSVTLTINSDDGDEAAYDFALAGTGTGAAEINVVGNSLTIADGDTTPDVADHTDFGSADVATGTVSRTFTIENTGTDVLTITSAGLTGADTADFSITTDPTGTVAASDSTTVVVEFNPTTAGPKSVTLTINSDDGDEAAYDFALAGTGTGAAEINVTGNSVSIVDGDTTPDVADHTDFGSVDVTAGTVSRTFTIENTGTDVLTITSAGLTGADTADFSITTDPTGTVAASDSTTVVVEFNPTTVGPKSVTLTINSDDGDEAAYDFALAGTGTGAAEINVVGNSLTIADGDTTPDVADHTDFGSADVATGTVSRTFTIENTGTDVLTITSAALSGADTGEFSIITAPAGTVAASNSTTVVVEFNPTAAGLKSATLTINSDDADEAVYDFALAGTGTGEPEINVVGNSLTIADGDTTPDAADHTDFGSADVTAGTVSRTFTIENTGTDVLTITSAGLTGADTADFSITTDSTGAVAASDSTTVVVEFNPTTAGPKSVTLTINSDDGDEAAYDFALAGTGTGAAEINVTGNSVSIVDGDTTPDVADHTDFGSADVATGTVSRTFTIENTGTDVLTITSAGLTGADTADFSITTDPTGTVAASDSTTVVVEFNPTTAGPKSVTLTINSDDGDEAAYDFALAGTGTGAAEINVTGNSVSIVDGDTTPDVADHTDFGSVDVTAGTVSRTFTIENTGTDVLTITSAGLTGADTADFSITTDPTGIVAASDSTTVVVEFNPTTVGPKSVTLTINSDDGDEAAYDFALAGTGTGAAEINVVGNSLTIADGDTTPDVADHTDFGSADVATGTVSRTFTIENTGTDVLTITSAALSGADTGEFSITTAPAGTVAAAGSTTVVVEFDPNTTGSKSATLTVNSDDADEAAYDFALAGTGTAGTATVNLVVNSIGGDVSVGFGSPTPALVLTIATDSGKGQSTIVGMLAGTHTVTATNMAEAGYGVTAISCNDSDSIGDVANGMATINLSEDETVTCTFDLLETRDVTGKLIADYLGARNNLIMSHQPDRSRRMDRLRGGEGGSSSGTVSAYGISLPNPVAVDMELNGNILSYATSLNRLRRMSPAFDHYGNNAVALPKLDIWMEGQISVFDAPADSGNFSIAFAGVDYLLNDRALIGIMGQFDSMTHHMASSDAKVSGDGWMIGPYGTFRLNDTFHLDLRGAWGQSSNRITPFGTYTDKFDTNRWLFTGALIGSFDLGNWTVSPAIEASYISETQQTYTDSLGVVIPKRTVSQGMIDIGPRLERDFELENEKTLSFFTEFKGVYSFGENDTFSNDTFADETQGLTGTVGTGISIHLKSGVKLSLSANIGGIGSGGNTYTGTAKLSIPLN